jgi:undecaprenyl diphosphate synthase
VGLGPTSKFQSYEPANLNYRDTPALTEEALTLFLSTAGAPPVDLLIRTGGESRVSNFLLWQVAYAELFFCDELWPDFKPE